MEAPFVKIKKKQKNNIKKEWKEGKDQDEPKKEGMQYAFI